MHIYLDIANHQKENPIKRIFNCTKKSTPSKPAMVIFNTDDDYGLYMKELNKIFKSIGMVEQSPIFREKALNRIRTGEFIVIGEDVAYQEFDFRVVTDQEDIEELDGRKFKVYDLIDDWGDILNKLSRYGKFTTNRSVFKGGIQNRWHEEEEERFVRPSLLDLRVEQPSVSRIFNQVKTEVNYTEVYRPSVKTEKITIFDSWVKIGMRQFDVYRDMLGNRLISVDGKHLYIKEDRYGRKYLAIR